MPGTRRSPILTSAATSVTALAIAAGLAILPQALDLGGRTEPVVDDDLWAYSGPEGQLRMDQCRMADVLRLGGPTMAQTAQDGLNLPADKLHALADRQFWEQTPLATAYKKDHDRADQENNAVHDVEWEWEHRVGTFWNPPGTHDIGDGKSFYEQLGLTKWISDRYWQKDDDFYNDPTPKMDSPTRRAVLALGDPRYPMYSTEGDGTYDERKAFQWGMNSSDWDVGAGADDARIFLAAGGFPRTAPQRGTPEYRIAVEDVKSRFASCAWRNPLDPNQVYNGITAAAAQEWQQEISSQATQRNQILNANKDAVSALVSGSKALGELLGHSAAADRLARWSDYWSPGGVGWVGDAPVVVQVHAAAGKCLDVEGGRTDNGTPVQLWTCNGTTAQQWILYTDGNGPHLQNSNSHKCLDAAGGKTDDRTKIQIYACNETPAQTWQYNLRATTPIKKVGAGKCLDLNSFDNGKDTWLWPCIGTPAQQFDVKPTGHHATDQPIQADFDKAKLLTTGAQTGAKQQLAALKAQLAAAQKAAAASDTALQTSYTSADALGAPRGRGLLVGQQKDQVTKGTAAALQAMVKAGETAEAATRASAGDSQTIAQRALAQAAQVQTEFRKKAAETAELQAKAAADAAKVHRDNAKKDKETAQAKLADTLKAEANAKAAAADAHAKRLAAEAESATAKAEKETALAKQADAAQHKQNAQSEAGKAKDAKEKAEAAESTAGEKRDGAVKARDNAKAKRDDAWDAQQKSDAARAKADAKEAYAQAHESDDQAKASRAAAHEADKQATAAETAAGNARSEADAASQAAADADAAATRAEAAAKRARSDADGAQAAKLVADAAVTTATSAEADAIAASQHASAEASAAVALADDAEAKAKTAKSEADAASKETAKAVEAAAKAAGFAHVTAQAAEDAGNAASQVAKPANDAIQLGSPYITTDSAAGLVVLTGQASKTIAEQQKAVADAHSKNAKEEAAAAQALADQAQADTKEAYQHAANAARYAADARGYATEALGYASDAANAASKAADSLARTVEYDRQATEDAAAANTAAGTAEGYAKEARTAADQAALDATAAHAAADQATQDAKDARAAADRANTAATEAEQAAKEADKYAKEAQDAADHTSVQNNNSQLQNGATTGVGGVFLVPDHIEQIGEPRDIKKENCNPIIHTGDCKITATIVFNEFVDIYLCTAEDAPATQYGCPSSDVVYLGPAMIPNLTETITKTLTMAEFNSGIDPIKILFGDFIECAKKILPGNDGGSWTSCAWAASWFVGGKALTAIADALHAFNAALHTGIGVREALTALKGLKLDAATAAELEETVDVYESVVGSCKVDSFPGSTQVLMGDRTRKQIRDVHTGDLVLATDPQSGRSTAQPVTATFHHATQHLLDIMLEGGVLTSTVGHRFYVESRGWIPVSALRVGDRLRSPGGTTQTVTALHDRPNVAAQEVYDLTINGLHTFYIRSRGPQAHDILVHNCTNILADEKPGEESVGGAHTLRDHVLPNDAEMAAEATKKGIATRWTDEATAAESVNAAVTAWLQAKPGNVKRLNKWLSDQSKRTGFDPRYDLLEIEWQLRDKVSLGLRWVKDGPQAEAVGNKVVVQLKFVRDHKPSKYVVYTAYPK
ncbi:virulence factor [Streptomyces sp. CB01201]|uniref:RICIN domain-containing protein n=1 Tax=Streptomyces sp. CB01201 TaxID=2020324 RepID=UPI000C274C11|nr:virulence factor [Streptomyces sp. CB01201]